MQWVTLPRSIEGRIKIPVLPGKAHSHQSSWSLLPHAVFSIPRVCSFGKTVKTDHYHKRRVNLSFIRQTRTEISTAAGEATAVAAPLWSSISVAAALNTGVPLDHPTLLQTFNTPFLSKPLLADQFCMYTVFYMLTAPCASYQSVTKGDNHAQTAGDDIFDQESQPGVYFRHTLKEVGVHSETYS